ncbi:MAG TPA: hypothetical protein VHG91_03405 [Longimicrobium sp.]|nr:hypothetical protein [Longimicrobium sp.]
MNDLIRQRLEQSGQTGRPVSLNTVFALLLTDQLDAYISTLDPVDPRAECVRVLELLKWIRGDQLSGFGFRRYSIDANLGAFLDAVAGTLNSSLKDWPDHRLEIQALGFGDSIPVRQQGIVLSYDSSGVSALLRKSGTPDVHYALCVGDKRDVRPFYIQLGSRAGQTVGEHINNNCEIGAVRSFFVVEYLATQLPSTNIDFSYATGGVSTTGATGAANRKVDILITLQSGRDTSE